MSVSVIIPCHNAEDTILETIESLFKQTYETWEAILVNDGSTDNTLNIINELSKKDKRIKVFSQPKSGVSVARNKGIDLANYEYILFLDSDDLILPEHLKTLTDALAAEPKYGAAYCSWNRLSMNGEIIKGNEAIVSGDIFPLLVKDCILTIHTCIIKKELIKSLNGFDTSLTTCEDWDLWQRVARTGAKFKAVNKPMALYRMRPTSASMDPRRMLLDAQLVIGRGYSKDPRVLNPNPLYINGAKPTDMVSTKYYLLCWSAGLSIGTGNDALYLFESAPLGICLDLFPETVAAGLLESSILPSAKTRKQWNELWIKYEDLFIKFLDKLEYQSKVKGLSRSVRDILERKFLINSAIKETYSIGRFISTNIDVTNPISDIKVESGFDHLVCNIFIGEKFIGSFELPILNSMVSSLVIKDSIAYNLGWFVLEDFFSRSVYKRLNAVRKIELFKKTKNKDYETIKKEYKLLHEKIGWTIYLQELWNKKYWTGNLFYNPSKKPALIKVKAITDNNIIHIELTEKVPNIKLNGKAINILFSMGGVPITVIQSKKKKGILHADEIISQITKELSVELLNVCVREVLIGKSFDSDFSIYTRLKTLYNETKKSSDNVKDYLNKLKESSILKDTMFVGSANDSFNGNSAYRFASLPLSVRDELKEYSKLTNSPIEFNEEPIKNILHVPGLLTYPSNIISSDSKLKKKQNSVSKKSKFNLPILMYHRVSPDGKKDLSRYRVTPELFESQLSYLKSNNYYSISLGEWRNAAKSNYFLKEKPILLTFDDGYKDFKEYAFPLLKKYGFTAIVFLVADFVGKRNSWDKEFKEYLELMNWDEISELKNNGIEFGSHTCSHPPLTSFSSDDIAKEALRSKIIIQKKLNTTIDSLAYPYGDFDGVTSHIVGACGYNFGLTCNSAIAKRDSKLLELPRIEVKGNESLEEFITKLGRGY